MMRSAWLLLLVDKAASPGSSQLPVPELPPSLHKQLYPLASHQPTQHTPPFSSCSQTSFPFTKYRIVIIHK